MRYLFLISFVIFTLSACSDECVTCEKDTTDFIVVQDYCDDGRTNFTDQNGEAISYEEFIKEQEDSGYTCR